MGVAAGLGLSPRAAAAFPMRVGRALAKEGGAVTYAIPQADGATIDRDNDLILVRYQNAIYAFALSCPHQNTALRWLDSDHVFQCPKHKSRYQPDGTFISGRATRGMDRLAIRRDGTNVIVAPDQFFQQDKEADKWGAAVVKL